MLPNYAESFHFWYMAALGLVVLEKKLLKSFPIYFNVKTFDPWGRVIFDPMGIFSTIYVEDL